MRETNMPVGASRPGRDDMSEDFFDCVVVGGGSAGAVIASRLSEDPSCRVALIEAGERPPQVSSMPVAPAAMQRNPATDWMYTADPGDFDSWAVGGAIGWSYAEVLPYFRK